MVKHCGFHQGFETLETSNALAKVAVWSEEPGAGDHVSTSAALATVGGYPDRTYAHLVDSPSQGTPLLGRLRAWDSFSVSIWGRASPERSVLQGYLNGTLRPMCAEPDSEVGDELFPVASYHHEGTWYVFYLPNGSPQGRDLAVAWGPDALRLEQSALVLDGSSEYPARCGANVVLLDDHVIVFVQRNWMPDIRAEVRIAPVEAPWKLGPPLRTWDGPLFREKTKFFTVTLDRERRTWLLYRLDWNRQFVLHAAPAGARDETPPGVPHQLTAERTSRGVRLRWKDAHDPESGVGQYRIRCDGTLVSESIPPSWEGEIDAANCAVSAVNLHGAEGPAATISLTHRGDSS
jgi:hypothetical protein